MLRAIRKFALAALPACCLVSARAAETGAPPAQPVLLDVSLNGQDEGVTLVLLRGNDVFVSLDDLRKWRLRDLPPASETRGEKHYVPLGAIAGLQAKIDEGAQRLVLAAPVSLFAPSVVEASGPIALPLSPRAFSAYVNYELSGQIAAGTASASAFAEAGVADRWGVITSSALGQTNSGRNAAAVRLDTSYIYDDPQALTRLVLGDAVTRGNTWMRSVRFAGIQFGTDFGLQPNFISFPSPSFAGQAALPTVIQAYVNDALRYSGEVPQGPFDLRQVPVVTGAGQVDFVLQDALGVQRSVRSSYYVSPNVLRAGLQDYSLEAGFVRNGYALESFAYGRPFASAAYRRGLSDTVTGELHLKGSGAAQTGGAGFAWVLAPLGEFDLAGAASNSALGTGLLAQAAFSHIDRWWSLAVSYQKASRAFVQVGAELPEQQVLTQAQAFGSVSFGALGSLSASYTQLEMGDHTRSEVAALNYDVALSDVAYVSAFALASRNSGSKSSATLGFQITFPLGEHQSATAGLSETDGRFDGRAEFRRDPPFGTGFGYRATLSPNEPTHADGQITWRNEVSTISAEAAATREGAAGRVVANGALAYAGGKAFAARELGDAFGVATVPGFPGVRVYQENQFVGRTDSQGRIALPELRAYQENRISIDPNDVPLDAQVSRDVLTLVPALHAAASADFAVTATRGALVLLVDESGKPFKPGIPVAIDGHAGEAFTGYDGQVFVAHAHDGAVIEAHWDGLSCAAKLGSIPGGSAQPRIGPVICRGAP